MFEDVPEISQKYDSFELMAKGGMGKIFRARHKTLDELRVIKTVRQDARTSDAKVRFQREAQIAAKLRHPNIASVFDFVLGSNEQAFLVMEFIEGMNLYQYYNQGERLSHAHVGLACQQILDAIDYLHSQQFIHRDLALDNIMVSQGPRGEVLFKLIDLGLAKSLAEIDSETKTGIALGKVTYISPEELTYGSGSEKIDGRADLYSFGVVLYQMLTGQLPISGTDQASIIAGHLYREPKSFEITDPERLLSDELRQILTKCLEKEPEDRYATAYELSRALVPALPPPSGEGLSEIVKQHTEAIELKGVELSSPDPKTEPALTLPSRRERVRQWFTGFERRALLLSLGMIAALVALWFLAPMAMRALRGSPYDGIAFGNYHALVIGNNEYQQMTPLKAPEGDARALATVLEHRYGFSVDFLPNATREQILEKLYRLERDLSERDNLLIFYAGHGSIEEGLTPIYYWQPVDAKPNNGGTWIPHSELEIYIDRMAARTFWLWRTPVSRAREAVLTPRLTRIPASWRSAPQGSRLPPATTSRSSTTVEEALPGPFLPACSSKNCEVGASRST